MGLEPIEQIFRFEFREAGAPGPLAWAAGYQGVVRGLVPASDCETTDETCSCDAAADGEKRDDHQCFPLYSRLQAVASSHTIDHRIGRGCRCLRLFRSKNSQVSESTTIRKASNSAAKSNNLLF